MLPPPEESRSFPWSNLLLLLFPLLLILPGLANFPYPPGNAIFSDITISHLPAVITLKRLILEYHQLPLWSPHLLGGAPLAANPLSSLFYPPAWLALILPLPAGFNLLVILHLAWGGLGMLRLLQAESLRKEAALFGGLCFVLLPKLYAHYGAGHLTLLYAVPWTPWLLLAWRQAGLRLGRLRIGEGGLLGLIFLADPRWAVYAGVLWLAYALKGLAGFPGWQARWPDIRRLVIQLGLAALIAAPLALPLLEYTRLSTRANLTPADNLAFSLPVARLLGLLFPSLGGAHEFELYSGGLILLLALLAAFSGAVRKPAGFWLAAALLSLTWALGENLPGLRWLASLPGFDLLRVPSRALFITGLALAALAAYAIQFLLASPVAGKLEIPRRLSLLLAGLAFFSLLLAGGAWLVSGQPNRSMLWGAGFLAASAGWVGLRLRGRLAPHPWLLGCVALVVLDLGFASRAAFSFHLADEVLAERSALVDYLRSQPGRFRVYSPSYSLPQQASAAAGLEHADGVDPLQLQAYADYFADASGVPLPGYSITLPPFASAHPESDNRSAQPDARLLGLLNVAYVAAEFPLSVPGLEWIGEFDGAQLYRNLQLLPRAWLQSPDLPLGEAIQPVAALDWTPNRIVIRLDPPPAHPAQLVLSEISYPGWQAWIDGKPAKLETAGSVLRSVSLEAGAREVVLRFRPLSVALGLLCGALGMGLLLWQGTAAAPFGRISLKEQGGAQ